MSELKKKIHCGFVYILSLFIFLLDLKGVVPSSPSPGVLHQSWGGPSRIAGFLRPPSAPCHFSSWTVNIPPQWPSPSCSSIIGSPSNREGPPKNLLADTLWEVITIVQSSRDSQKFNSRSSPPQDHPHLVSRRPGWGGVERTPKMSV